MSDSLERGTMGRVRVRLLPLLCLIYISAYLDRSNVGVAALQMNGDLGFGPAISRIAITWGFVSCAMVWVRTPMHFYFARLLLGPVLIGHPSFVG